jgi:hypothetical protein
VSSRIQVKVREARPGQKTNWWAATQSLRIPRQGTNIAPYPTLTNGTGSHSTGDSLRGLLLLHSNRRLKDVSLSYAITTLAF